MLYHDGTPVQVGDRVQHGVAAAAVVESIIQGEDVQTWGTEEEGFMPLCEQCGRVFIEPGSSDWEDVVPIRPV